LLSQTGLYADIARATVAAAVLPYTPRYELWSDGAAKQRWIALPASAQIDSADMDAWRFPEGTKLWKEFRRDGVRLETRLLHKVGPDDADWLAVAYAWRADGHDADLASAGVVHTLGTEHDIPSATQCQACHGGARSFVLGFSAIQLTHLEAWHEHLSNAPAQPIEVPGDAVTQAALGYLHANCGHCHNQHRPSHDGPRCFDPRKTFDLSLRVHQLGAVEQTPTYQTALATIVTPGAPEESTLLRRLRGATLFGLPMPPLGAKKIDRAAVKTLSTWIASLAHQQPSER